MKIIVKALFIICEIIGIVKNLYEVKISTKKVLTIIHVINRIAKFNKSLFSNNTADLKLDIRINVEIGLIKNNKVISAPIKT